MDSSEHPANAERVTHLRQSINPGEPPEGVLHRDGDDRETRFVGWIALIAAITAAREP